MACRRPRGGRQLGEDRLVASPRLLQGLDSDVEPRQSDIVIKIERIGDLLVDLLARGGDLFVASLAGACHPPAQIIEFRGILRLSGYSEQQSAGVSRLFDRADMGLCERGIGGAIVMVDDDELVINGTGHAHAQESHDGHEDQQPDGDAEYLNPDGDAHGRLQSV